MGTWRYTSAEFRAAFEAFVAENRIDEEAPIPGETAFACGSSADARLEAMPSTAGVWVPISRTNGWASATTNTLTAIYPNGERATSNIVWTTGTGRQTQEVFFSTAVRWANGGSIVLQLRDAEGMLNATNAITCVAEADPSIHFPLWPGERTEATLGYGEWTFDFDVATNKVRLAAADGTAAYTLVVVGGGLWCPDCISCERDLTEDPRFANWAAANNIALVVSDQPRNGTTTSSMVTHDVGGRGASVTSGSYYLSRKGLTMAEGMAQFVTMTNRSYRLWKVEPSAVRVANPTFILFRPDGTIAGRLTESRIKEDGVRQNNEKYDFAENMARLEELIALAGDDTEEKNNKPGTTTLPAYVFGATNTCRIQVSDTADVFPFSGVPADEKFRVVVTGGPGAKALPTARILTITNAATGACSALPPLAAGGNVWRLTQEEIDAGLFLEVSAYASESTGRYAIYGGGTEFTATFHTEAVPIQHGAVGFKTSAIQVTEGKDNGFLLTFARSGGSDGAVSAVVSLDLTSVTADNLLRIGWDVSAEHRLEWDDMDEGEASLWVPIYDDAVWDGDAPFIFTVTPEGGATNGTFTVCTVTLKEDDVKSPGTVRISRCEPSADVARNVYVREGGSLCATLERVGGSWGEAVARVVCGGFATNVVWNNKDSLAARRIPVDVSGLVAGDVVALSLSGVAGAALDAGNRRFTVHVLAADAPMFAPVSEMLELVSATACDGVLARTEAGRDGWRLIRTAGRDAAGVEIVFDDETGELRMTGAAKESGEFESTWRLVHIGENGAVEWGVPLAVSYAVRAATDLVPALAVSRSWNGLPMMSESRLACLLDLSVPRDGKTSAKLRTAGGVTVAFAGKRWQRVDSDGLHVEIGGTKAGWRLAVTARTDGTVVCSVTDPSGGTSSCTAPESPWSMRDVSAYLSRWRGTYTLEMPQDTGVAEGANAFCTGPATFSLRFMTAGALRSGSVTCAGVLPNGKTVSGTFMFQPSGDAAVLLLPIYSSSSSDTLGALLRVAGDGASQAEETRQVIRLAEGAIGLWKHEEGAVSAAGYEATLDAYGSYYVPEDWERRIYDDYFGAESLPLVLEGMENVLHDAVLCAEGLNLWAEGGEGADFTFSFSPETGIVRGTFSAMVGGVRRTANWRGVILPGWAEGCGCGFEEEPEIVRPFLSAAAWWTEQRTLQDDFGRSRKASVRAGVQMLTR